MPSADRLIEIFNEANGCPPGEPRDRFLAETCKEDAELRDQILSLIASHQAAERFLEVPVLPGVSGAPEKPGDRIGRYKLLEKVGEGGCGVVYVAEQTDPVRRRVAVKVIKLGMDTSHVIARFEAERQALAMMDHPNIAKVLDAGSTEAGRPFFVMELVRGIRITEYCDQHKLQTKERLDLFIKVCQAIQHAHQKGIIHRDIKPSNILVTMHDGVPVPKVIDFGIAKATEGRLTDNTVYTQLHQFIGTPAYMSPEQAEMSGLDVDTRSDIYSLGVLLYELLVGTTPFDGQELVASGLDAMRKTIREKEPTRPSTKLSQVLGASEAGSSRSSMGKRATEGENLVASRRLFQTKETIGFLRGDLDWIVMKCLEKDRTRRYDTANGLFQDIQRHLTNEPVVARPPSQLYRFQKAFRRNKVSFTAAAAVVVALVLGIGVSSWQAFEAGRQRLRAQNERDKSLAAKLEAEESQRAEKEARLQAEAEKINAQHDRYVANINLAGQAWEHDNFGRMRKVLEDTRDFADRGFEWYYWQRQAHLNLLTLRGHQGNVTSVAYSPDGQRIVTASSDRTARIWEAASGRELTRLIGHNHWVGSAAFSPDGLRVVTAAADHLAIVWQSTTGRKLFELVGHTNAVNSVAYSADGRWIVTGSSDRTARIWEAASGKFLRELAGHTNGIICVAFSPDSKLILTGSSDCTARMWDASTGRPLHILGGHETEVHAVGFFPDGQRMATGALEPIVKIWDVTSGQKLFQLEGGGTATSMAISPDGRRLCIGSWDSAARMWDLATGKIEQTFRGSVKGVLSVAFSPDGRQIATAGGDAIVKVWEANPDLHPLRLQGNLSNVLCVAFSPDGKRVVTGTGLVNGDNNIRGSGDRAGQVWDAASGAKLFALTGHDSGIGAVAFFRDGSRIVTGSGDHTAMVWDAAIGRSLVVLTGHTDSVCAVSVSPDGRYIVTGSHDETARVWDAVTGRELFKLSGHTAPVSGVAFSTDGKWIVTGSHDRTVLVWETPNRLVRTIKTPIEQIYSVAFSPDSQRIAACGWGMGMVWNLLDSDAAPGRLGPITMHGFGSPMSSLAFSPDGKRIVSGSFDGAAKVWEAATGQELLTLYGHRSGINSVAISPEGKRIVTGSHDRTALLWEAATEEQVTAWDAEEAEAIKVRPTWERELEAQLRERGVQWKP